MRQMPNLRIVSARPAAETGSGYGEARVENLGFARRLDSIQALLGHDGIAAAKGLLAERHAELAAGAPAKPLLDRSWPKVTKVISMPWMNSTLSSPLISGNTDLLARGPWCSCPGHVERAVVGKPRKSRIRGTAMRHEPIEELPHARRPRSVTACIRPGSLGADLKFEQPTPCALRISTAFWPAMVEMLGAGRAPG